MRGATPYLPPPPLNYSVSSCECPMSHLKILWLVLDQCEKWLTFRRVDTLFARFYRIVIDS